MHYASVKWICFLLFVVVGKVAMAEGITSPDGNLRLEFTVNALGEPVYQCFTKRKPWLIHRNWAWNWWVTRA